MAGKSLRKILVDKTINRDAKVYIQALGGLYLGYSDGELSTCATCIFLYQTHHF